MADFIIDSLEGGLDTTTPVSKLPKNACTVADNVEFYNSTMGERRAGTTAFTLPAGITGSASAGIVWTFGWFPDEANPATAELWVLAFKQSGPAFDTPLMYRRALAGWSNVAFPTTDDQPRAPTIREGFEIAAIPFNSKLFIAYKSSTGAIDRLHVWDGTSLRRVGIAANAVPTVADQGVGAYAAVLRYYRTRSVKRSGSTVLLRSEPSPSVSFTPSGAGLSARVTRAALPGESETDWEVEASLDNAVFYRLATVAAATTFYDDSAATTTYVNNPQSDPLLTYSLVPSVKYLSADDDRLIFGGGHTVGSFASAYATAIQWTPGRSDPSPGFDERLNLNTSPRLDLEGEVTGLSAVTSDTLYATQLNKGVYRVVRTGQLVGAYEAKPITKRRGAFPRSLVDAFDEGGRSALYLWDPFAGPFRVGAPGLQWLGRGLRSITRRVNHFAYQPVFGIYYPDKEQVRFWLCLDGAYTPNYELRLQTNLIRTTEDGDALGGWSSVPTGDREAGAWTATVFLKDLDSFSTTPDTTRVPFIAGGTGTVTGTSVTPVGSSLSNILHRCETGTTDNGTAYTAKVRTKPFALANILNAYGVKNLSILASIGSSIKVTVRRNYGTETKSGTATLTAVASETHAVNHLDDLDFAELFALEIEFADNPSNVTQWQLLQCAVKEMPEQTA